MKKKPSMSYLTKKLDKVTSELIRKRGKCERCGRTETLQCCHIYSRNNRAVRWEPINLLCLCAGCHFFAHQNPLEFSEFVQDHLGQEKYNKLIAMANVRKVRARYELETMIADYKEELEK